MMEGFDMNSIFEKLKDPELVKQMVNDLAQQGPPPTTAVGTGGTFDPTVLGTPPLPGMAAGVTPGVPGPVQGLPGNPIPPVAGLPGNPIPPEQVPAPAQQAAIPPPLPAVPAPAPDVEANKNAWGKFLESMQTDEGRRTALEMAARIIQPRAYGQTTAGHIGEALVSGVEGMSARRKERANQARQEKLDKLLEQKTASEINAQGTQAEYVGRKTKSLDFEDDLTQAQAELARAKARAEKTGKLTAGGAQIALENAKVVSWYNAHPGKFKDLDDARANLTKFETTKGKSAYAGAMESLLQDLPVWKAEKLRPILDLVKSEASSAEEVQPSARVQAEEKLKGLSKEDWMRVNTDPAIRQKLETTFGADVVANYMREHGL